MFLSCVRMIPKKKERCDLALGLCSCGVGSKGCAVRVPQEFGKGPKVQRGKRAESSSPRIANGWAEVCALWGTRSPREHADLTKSRVPTARAAMFEVKSRIRVESERCVGVVPPFLSHGPPVRHRSATHASEAPSSKLEAAARPRNRLPWLSYTERYCAHGWSLQYIH